MLKVSSANGGAVGVGRAGSASCGITTGGLVWVLLTLGIDELWPELVPGMSHPLYVLLLGVSTWAWDPLLNFYGAGAAGGRHPL